MPRHQIMMMIAHLDLQAEARLDAMRQAADPAGAQADQALQRDDEARNVWATTTWAELVDQETSGT